MQSRYREATILVVDDDLEVRNYFETLLKLQGYKVLLAESGEETIELLRAGDPAVHLILLDVMMPGKSGWEVARALKADPVTENIKIVMVTAIGESMNEITSPLYGADAHIDKPFEFDRLESIVSTLLA